MDANKLHDLPLFSDSLEVSQNSKTFVAKTSKKKSKVAVCGINKKGVAVVSRVSVRGEMTFSEEVLSEEVDENDLLIQPPAKVTQPTGLGDRHALFGVKRSHSEDAESPTKKAKRSKVEEVPEEEEEVAKSSKKKKSKKSKK